MAKKKGTGLLMVWVDVPADKEAEFNRWYNEEHLAERLGFERAHRYVGHHLAEGKHAEMDRHRDQPKHQH